MFHSFHMKPLREIFVTMQRYTMRTFEEEWGQLAHYSRDINRNMAFENTKNVFLMQKSTYFYLIPINENNFIKYVSFSIR